MTSHKSDAANSVAEDVHTIQLSADVVGRVYGFAAENDVRFYLNGVALFPGERPIVGATDGHIAYLEEDACGVVSAHLIISISKRGRALLKAPNRVCVTIKDGAGSLTIRTADGTPLYVEPGDCLLPGRFPSLLAVVPPYKDLAHGLVGTFQSQLIKKACQLPGALEFFHSTKAEPRQASAVWTHEVRGGAKGIGVVMPVREGSSLESRYPAALRA